MRTWSVSGTAFALWTRSSSLSMSTSTSMRPRSLLLRRNRRTALGTRKHLLEAACHLLWNEVLDVAAEGRHLLHAARGEEAVLRARHQVHRLDLGSEVAVEVVHLELPLEIRDRAQALDHRRRAPAARELDDELREDVDLDVVLARERVLEKTHPLLDREQRLLVQRVADDADDDALEDRRRAPDDVEVPVRDWVVAAGANGGDGLAGVHSSFSK